MAFPYEGWLGDPVAGGPVAGDRWQEPCTIGSGGPLGTVLLNSDVVIDEESLAGV